MESPVRRFNDTERAKLKEELEAFYGQFVQKVAATRHMPAARVDELGRGRVWTGLQAKANGLVDELGGLDAAVALAKKRAGIAAGTEVELVSYPERKTLFELLAQRLAGANDQAGMSLDLRIVAGLLGAGDRHTLGMLTAPMRLFSRGEPLALLPITFIR